MKGDCSLYRGRTPVPTVQWVEGALKPIWTVLDNGKVCFTAEIRTLDHLTHILTSIPAMIPASSGKRWEE
jgi:hypothetical protein